VKEDKDIISVLLPFFYTLLLYFFYLNLGSSVAYGVPVSEHAPAKAAVLEQKALKPPTA
jgi:hypothetical protein